MEERAASLEDVKARLTRLEALETHPPRVAAVADRARLNLVSTEVGQIQFTTVAAQLGLREILGPVILGSPGIGS